MTALSFMDTGADDGEFVGASVNAKLYDQPNSWFIERGLLPNKELIDKTLEFCIIFSGKNWYAYQKVFAKRIIESVILNDGEVITGLWSRQSGKTETVANTVLGLAVLLPALATQVYPDDPRLMVFRAGFWAGVFAPIEEQANISHSRMRGLVGSDTSAALVSECGTRVTSNSGGNLSFENGSYIHARSASPESKIEGKTYHLVIIEEAQLVTRYKVNKEIAPMLAACVTSDTKVTLLDGSIETMETVQRKKLTDVYSVSSSGNIVPAKISEFIDSGIQPTMGVTLKSGREVKGTHHHPLLVYDRSLRKPVWRKIEDIKLGEHVCLPRELPSFGRVSIGLDEAYFLGAMIGDGSYRRDSLPRLNNCDDDVWRSVTRVCEKQGCRISYYLERLTKDGRNYREATFTGDGGKGNNWAINLLSDFGLYGQVGEEKTLGSCLNLCRDELASLIAGLYDTDGCVVEQGGRTGIISITQSSRTLLIQLLDALQKFGVHGCVRQVFYPARELRGQQLGPGSAWLLNISGKQNIEAFHKNISLRISYKQKKLEAIVAYLASHISKKSSDYPELVWEKVIEKRDCGEQQVWDVVVPEHHSFIANGIISHNTNGSMVKIGTAHMSKGGFHNSIQFNVSRYEQGGTRNHFEFPYDLVIREKRLAYRKDGNVFHLNYERWVTKEIARLGGTENEEFEMNFKLQWKESRLIAIREGMFTKLGRPDLEYNAFNRSGYQVAGLDLAKSGDSTVLTIMRVDTENPILDVHTRRHFSDNEEPVLFYNKLILGWLELQGSFEGDDGQYSRLIQFLSYWGVKRLAMDATGAGDPIYERMQVLLPSSIEIIPFKYSKSSKSDLFKHYLQELVSKRIGYPAGRATKESWSYQQFMKQHLNLDREYDGEYLVVAAPEGEHDDYPNSAALAAHAAKLSDTLPEVETTHQGAQGRSEIAGWRKVGEIASSRTSRYSKRW